MFDLAITGAKIFTPFTKISNGVVLIKNEKIKYVGNWPDFQWEARRSINAAGGLLCPGFIDIHVHGGGGNFMKPDSTGFRSILETCARHGATSVIATTLTAPFPELLRVVESIAAIAGGENYFGARILGIHLEGPFLNKEFRGAHVPDHIRPVSITEIAELDRAGNGNVKMLTFAPELEGALDLNSWLLERGKISTIGHTGAYYEQAMTAIRAGMNHATHMFNAMRGFSHREPGTVGAIMDSDNITVQIIADGIHVHPAAIRIMLKNRGAENVILVTDAIDATDMNDGIYDLGGLRVHVSGGKAILLNGGDLAGSTLTINKAVYNMHRFTGCSLADAIRMATVNPARLLGVARLKGSLEAGKDADLVLVNTDFEVKLTVVEGRIVYRCAGRLETDSNLT